MKTNLLNSLILILITGAMNIKPAQEVTGELKKWHKITVTFTSSANYSETGDPNPYLNNRLNVTFTNGSNTYLVPGYFAADGDAAETSAESGNKWRVHFAPDAEGEWTYTASFRQGSNVSVSLDENAGTAADFNGETGTFTVGPTDKTGRDFRGKGRLQYVNMHHLRFAETGEFFIKGGADAPENLLAYDDFDNTPDNGGRRKDWGPHVQDWNNGDPTWMGDKGKGIIGAINYLSEEGANVFSFLTMNINGDDKNVFPYIADNQRTRIDVSKTAQWEILFEHADKIGMYLHFKTQETENDQLLDGGNLGNERKLYYRELVARFGHHLALNWNIGEENTQTDSQIKDCIKFFKDIDPYDHNVVIHTYPGQQDKVYGPLLGDNSLLTGTSIQTNWNNVHEETREWVRRSAESGKPWVVANDEQGSANDGVVPDSDDQNHDGIRKETLWGNFMAGGAGVEYYFGYQHDHSDLTAEDFRSRANMWDQTRYALELFQNEIPFWRMTAADELTSENDDYILALIDSVYLVYDKDGGNVNLDFGNTTGDFTARWYNPRTGAFEGDVLTRQISGAQDFGNPPNSTTSDWALLIIRDGFEIPVSSKEVTRPQAQGRVFSEAGRLVLKGYGQGEKLQVDVFNLQGIRVTRQHLFSENFLDHHLNSGMYIIKVTGADRVTIQKIILK